MLSISPMKVLQLFLKVTDIYLGETYVFLCLGIQKLHKGKDGTFDCGIAHPPSVTFIRLKIQLVARYLKAKQTCHRTKMVDFVFIVSFTYNKMSTNDTVMFLSFYVSSIKYFPAK